MKLDTEEPHVQVKGRLPGSGMLECGFERQDLMKDLLGHSSLMDLGKEAREPSQTLYRSR